MTNLTHNFCIL